MTTTKKTTSTSTVQAHKAADTPPALNAERKVSVGLHRFNYSASDAAEAGATHVALADSQSTMTPGAFGDLTRRVVDAVGAGDSTCVAGVACA